MPGDFDVSMKLFGHFAVKDLARLSLPVLPGLLTRSIIAVTAGAILGILWFIVKPYGQPLDHHLVHAIRWFVSKQQVEGPDIGSFDPNSVDTGITHDTVKTKDGGLAAVLRVQPTNLSLKTDAEQGALHNIYQNLLETVNYSIQVHSRQEQFDLSDYLNSVENCDIDSSTLKSDYVSYTQGFEDQQLTRTTHYIVIHVEPDGLSFLRKQYNQFVGGSDEEDETQGLDSELDSRCHEVSEAINTSELSADRLTDGDLLRFVNDASKPFPETGTEWNTRNGTYSRTLQIEEFPSNVELAWPLQLLRTEGMVDTVQVIEPQNPSDASKKLKRLSEKLNAEIDSLLAGGHRGTNKLESLLDDTEWFLNTLAARDAQPVNYSAYLTIHHTNESKALQTFENVCNRLDTLGFEYSHPFLRTDQAYRTHSPLYRDSLNNSMLVPSSSAAAGFPFATQDSANSGLIYGADVYDGTPVLLDRFDWSSHSMARMGTVGSGKSYAGKLELLRAALIYDDLEIIVVDPKQEYSDLVEGLDGDVHTLDGSSYSFEGDTTCLTVKERGQRENVDLLTDAVEQVYSYVSQNTRRTLVIVDEARVLLNDKDGRQVLNQFVLEGRDTNTAVTLITQNASHFTHCREGREILDNMPGKVFMRHDRVPDDVVDYFDLSQREKQELFELRTGTDAPYSEALLHVSGRIKTRLRIESTDREHELIAGGEQ
jgi:type IV secretory pathway VirB4 component